MLYARAAGKKTQGAAHQKACLSTDFSPPGSRVLPETPRPAQQAEPVPFPQLPSAWERSRPKHGCVSQAEGCD